MIISKAEVIEKYVQFLINTDSFEWREQFLDYFACHQPLTNTFVLDAQIGIKIAKI